MKNWDLDRKQKLQYIWDYYKPQIALVLIVCILGISGIVHLITKKTVLLTTACVDIDVGEETLSDLSDGYIRTITTDVRNPSVTVLNHMTLLSTDGEQDGVSYEYAYASEAKLTAMITDEKLDIVLMDEDALEVFTRNDYLMELPDEDSDHIEITDCPLMKKAGFSDPVYAGIIANTTHKEEALTYLQYLQS
jgi:hypothetical protein